MPRRKLTQKDIAAALGLTQARVSQLAKRGMPVNDIERARAWRDANLQPAMVAAHARPAPEGAPVPPPSPEALPPGANGAYFEARAKREAAEAALSELDLARKRGELVDRAGVERAAMATARLLRDMVLGDCAAEEKGGVFGGHQTPPDPKIIACRPFYEVENERHLVKFLLPRRLLAVPTAVAAEVAALDDAHAVELRLREALRAALQEVSRIVAGGLQA